MLLIAVCNAKSIAQNNSEFDIQNETIPYIVQADYIETSGIERISRFRSAIGHDYSDAFESCRNMKHYFQPADSIDWSAVRIFSPVDGQVVKYFSEWAGDQIWIQSAAYPAFIFIIFHLNPGIKIQVNDRVEAGQLLGTHIGSQTMSDIAVGVNTTGGWKLISYFEVMPDTLFEKYLCKTVSSRNAFIISAQERNSDTLNCYEGKFAGEGTLGNWVNLKHTF